MFWNEARIILNGELKKFEATRVGSDVKCSQYGCPHYEDTVVSLDRNMLEQWANSSIPIKVRLMSSKVSTSVDIEIDPSEAKAFLAGMDFEI